jgi:HK97 family phage portal protein
VQVLTDKGSYETVEARSWPLAGTAFGSEYSQGWASLRLTGLPTGEARMLTYRKIYRSNPWVWSAVNLIARGVGSQPIRVRQLDADGFQHEIRGDVPQGRPGPPSAAMQLDNLLRRPAPKISRRKLITRTKKDELIYGNALWVKEGDGYGGVTGLWHVPWREVAVIAGKDDPIVGYRVMGSSGSKVFSPDEVVQFGEGDPDAPIAPSPLEAMQYTISLFDAMYRAFTSYFQNAMRPSGVLTMGQMPDDRELGIIREQIKELFSGSENSGKPLITSGQWKSMSEGTSWSDLLELIRLSRDEVAAGYQIPPPILGILDGAIKANVSELREMYLRDLVAPHGSGMTDEIDCQLCGETPAWINFSTGFDFSERLLPDLEKLALAFKTLKQVYTINELRRMKGLTPLADPETGKQYEWANQPWMEPGSLPAGLAPQGATVNPEGSEGDGDDGDESGDVEPPDDEEED